MPLAFEAFPGLGIAAVRVARGDHPVDATGPAMGLSNMIPAVPAIAQANGALRYPLVFLYWLLLPIVHWGADIPGGTFLADFISSALNAAEPLQGEVGMTEVAPPTSTGAWTRPTRAMKWPSSWPWTS